VRRLAHEAADAGLLSPDLAAGISRVKGVKQLGQRSGNWLSLEQSSNVLIHAQGDHLRQKRDYAMLALLFGCGLRRSELVGLGMSDVQQRQEHWAIVDLIGKGGHIRTVPIPEWTKRALDEWTVAAGIRDGKIFRRVSRTGKVWGKAISPRTWSGTWSRAAAKKWGWSVSRRTICGEHARSCAIRVAARSNRFNFCSATPLCRRPNATWAASRT
jgi:site-specific recombinase XerC